MDEVDGRPGPVARKFGHLDASHGVLPLSLSLPQLNLSGTSSKDCHPERSVAEPKDLRFASPRSSTHQELARPRRSK